MYNTRSAEKKSGVSHIPKNTIEWLKIYYAVKSESGFCSEMYLHIQHWFISE